MHTNHKCAGEALATLMMKSLAVRLVRDFSWSWTQGQDFGYSLLDLPTTPRDGVLIDYMQPWAPGSMASMALVEQRARTLLEEDKVKSGRARPTMPEPVLLSPVGSTVSCPVVAKTDPARAAPPVHVVDSRAPMAHRTTTPIDVV